MVVLVVEMKEELVVEMGFLRVFLVEMRMKKVVVRMGCLVFYGEKEEEEDMEVVLLLEMEEETEGRMVEDLVKEWWRR